MQENLPHVVERLDIHYVLNRKTGVGTGNGDFVGHGAPSNNSSGHKEQNNKNLQAHSPDLIPERGTLKLNKEIWGQSYENFQDLRALFLKRGSG